MTMPVGEQVRDLLLELGEGCDAIDGIVQEEEGEWALLFDETRRFDVDLDERREVLVLRTTVGEPAADRRLEALEALLSYNLLWPQTGGARMALGGTGGAAVLLMDVPLAGLAWGQLDSVLRNLAATADAWREFLAMGAPPPASSVPWPGQLA